MKHVMAVRSHLVGIVFVLSVCSGCATMSGSQEQYYVCSYDSVWQASLESMQGESITSYDKTKGSIETAWKDVEPLTERSFGIFGREGFGNKERARMTVSVKPMQDVAAVSVLETRQRWHARGGATSQATKWWPTEPSQAATAVVVDRINAKLKEQGCLPS